MSVQTTEDQLVRDLAAHLSSFNQLRFVANSLQAAGTVVGRKRDLFDMFPDPGDQLARVSNLEREIAYSKINEIHLNVTPVSPGVSYSLDWVFVDEQGNEETIAEASGDYGTFVSLTPVSATNSIDGEIKLKKPSENLSAEEKVILTARPNAKRHLIDVGGFQNDQLRAIQNSITSLGIIGSNIDTPDGSLFNSFKEEAVESSFFEDYVAKTIGTAQDATLIRNVSARGDGEVVVDEDGVLPALERFFESKGKQFQKSDVSVENADFSSANGSGSLQATADQSLIPGELQFEAIDGFSDSPSVADAAEFEVTISSTELGISEEGEVVLSINKSWDSAKLGLSDVKIERDTIIEGDDNNNIQGDPTLTGVSKNNTPIKELKMEVSRSGGSPFYTIIEPQSGDTIASTNLLTAGGEIRIETDTGHILEFTDGNNGTDSDIRWKVEPFESGDLVTADAKNSLDSQFNEALIEFFRYAFQNVSDSPNVDEDLIINFPLLVLPELGVNE